MYSTRILYCFLEILQEFSETGRRNFSTFYEREVKKMDETVKEITVTVNGDASGIDKVIEKMKQLKSLLQEVTWHLTQHLNNPEYSVYKPWQTLMN